MHLTPKCLIYKANIDRSEGEERNGNIFAGTFNKPTFSNGQINPDRRSEGKKGLE